MTEEFELEWFVSPYMAYTDRCIKIKLAKIILDSLFLCEAKDNCLQLAPSLTLYYNPEITEIYTDKKDGWHYYVSQGHNHVLIVPDRNVNNSFIMVFYEASPNHAYRSYIHCKIDNNKFDINPIPDFDSYIPEYSIIYSNGVNHPYHKVWDFDNRNFFTEILSDGILIICCYHRDSWFPGCGTIHCHDISNNKRWLYSSISTKPWMSRFTKFKIDNKILSIGDYKVNIDISNHQFKNDVRSVISQSLKSIIKSLQ